MGEVELIENKRILIIRSEMICYGDLSTDDLAHRIANDISSHWNIPGAKIKMKGDYYEVRFEITGKSIPDLDPELVWYNDDPKLNYFRIQEYVVGDISFVDGLNSNTGVFKLANLLQTSTTTAHEYGHTLGLDHPDSLDHRGKGIPSIMFPRGTLCDNIYQYWPHAKSGEHGGTLDPSHRIVTREDIEQLHLPKLRFDWSGKARLGDFTSIYHYHQEPAQ